jgi:signal transduction histidine kinase
VRLRYGADALDLEVADNGRGAAAGVDTRGSGQGLVGMRERVEAFSGTLDAGPRPGGGFAVMAHLPVGSAT